MELTLVSPYVSAVVICSCSTSKDMGLIEVGVAVSLALSSGFHASPDKLYGGRPCSGHYGLIPLPSAPPLSPASTPGHFLFPASFSAALLPSVL